MFFADPFTGAHGNFAIDPLDDLSRGCIGNRTGFILRNHFHYLDRNVFNDFSLHPAVYLRRNFHGLGHAAKRLVWNLLGHEVWLPRLPVYGFYLPVFRNPGWSRYVKSQAAGLGIRAPTARNPVQTVAAVLFDLDSSVDVSALIDVFGCVGRYWLELNPLNVAIYRLADIFTNTTVPLLSFRNVHGSRHAVSFLTLLSLNDVADAVVAGVACLRFPDGPQNDVSFLALNGLGYRSCDAIATLLNFRLPLWPISNDFALVVNCLMLNTINSGRLHRKISRANRSVSRTKLLCSRGILE